MLEVEDHCLGSRLVGCILSLAQLVNKEIGSWILRTGAADVCIFPVLLCFGDWKLLGCFVLYSSSLCYNYHQKAMRDPVLF